MNNFDKTLKEFITVIKETKEYTSYKAADMIFKSDKEASKLLEEFQSSQQTLQIFRQGNFPGVDEQERKVRELYRKVQNSRAIMDWAKSQGKLQAFIGDLATELTNQINFPFTLPQKGGCCG